jgi:hypothetical protein
LQRREAPGVVGLVLDCRPESLALGRAGERHHELDILYVLAVVLPQLVGRHVDELPTGRRIEPVEGREELVVSGRHGGRRQKRTH